MPSISGPRSTEVSSVIVTPSMAGAAGCWALAPLETTIIANPSDKTATFNVRRLLMDLLLRYPRPVTPSETAALFSARSLAPPNSQRRRSLPDRRRDISKRLPETSRAAIGLWHSEERSNEESAHAVGLKT